MLTLRRKSRWNTRNSTIGSAIEISRAAPNTSSSTVSRMIGRRTDSGWISGFGNTIIGQRKPFQALSIARIDTAPRIGRDSGSATYQSWRNGPAPSTWAASNSSRGRPSVNRFTSRMKALAPAGSHTAQ